MAKPVSGETLSNVLEQRGMSKAELARRMGVTPPTVASWFKSEEIPSKRVRRLRQILGPLTVRSNGGEMPVSGRTLHEVMYRQGMSDSKLAELMGVTPPAVAYWQKVDTVPAKRIARLAIRPRRPRAVWDGWRAHRTPRGRGRPQSALVQSGPRSRHPRRHTRKARACRPRSELMCALCRQELLGCHADVRPVYPPGAVD